MRNRATMFNAALASVVLLVASSVAEAQTVATLTVSGNRADAVLELAGGTQIDLTIAFEQVVGLNPGALDVSASLVSTADQGLLSRMPTVDMLIPAALPVLIRIDPSAASALSFSGVVSVGLHTHNLSLDLAAPFVLLSSSNGGPFRDITSRVAVGSYRVDGSGGGFSEFIIARDPRSLSTILAEKFDQLDGSLTAHAEVISAEVMTDLRTHLAQARSLASNGLFPEAIAEVTAFIDVVKAQGGAIPDVWRAHDTRTNVSGLLRSAAQTLQFTLTLQSNEP